MTTRKERVRRRSVRICRWLDRVDGDWQSPAQLERLLRFVYRNLTL